MANLQLPLTKQWFDMTKSGIKTEDYREIDEYWFSRLILNHKKVFKYITGHEWDGCQFRYQYIHLIVKNKVSMIAAKPFDFNIMTWGYPKKENSSRILQIEHKGIEIREGNPDFGATPGVVYFVIKHGQIIN